MLYYLVLRGDCVRDSLFPRFESRRSCARLCEVDIGGALGIGDPFGLLRQSVRHLASKIMPQRSTTHRQGIFNANT